MTTGGTSVGTNGFLFCDLRGYTAFIEQHGDQAAAELLGTYRSLVRAVIADHAGAEIRTEGDSVYVVFPAASAAVEAGLEIAAAAATQSTKTVPIRVGVGVHAGETVATTEGLVGGAVNIAARVCAKAKAGEVLVTDTVRALTRTYLPYRYTSLGTQQLKGIAGGIPLYRVEAVPSSARARLARQLGARRGRVLVLAGLVVVALVAATGVYALNRPTDCLALPAATKDVVARIDPARNCVVAVYPVGQRPASAVFVDGTLWVANLDDQTLTWIDPALGTSGTTAAGGPPIALAPAAKSVVVLDHTARIGSTSDSALVQNDQVALVLNAAKRMLDSPARLPDPRLGPRGSFNFDTGGYQSIIVVADSAWVTNAATGQVVRIPVGGGGATAVEIEPPTSVGIGSPRSGIGPIASGRGTVWVANLDQPVVYRMDGFQAPATRFSLDGSSGSRAIDVTDDAIWLIRTDGRLTRLRLGGSIATFDTGGSSTNLAVGADTVWVADTTGRMVRSIDPATGAVLTTIPVGGRPNSIAIAPDGGAWVTIQAP